MGNEVTEYLRFREGNLAIWPICSLFVWRVYSPIYDPYDTEDEIKSFEPVLDVILTFIN